MSAQFERWWADYEEHHRAEGNQWCHVVGIPLILAGLLGLLSLELFRVGGLRIEVALLVVVATGVAYLWLEPRLGGAMFGVSLVIYLVARLLDWRLALALFVVGWIFQLVGHGVYEKRSPAFLRNLAHLLIGPLWVLHHLTGMRPAAARAGAHQPPEA